MVLIDTIKCNFNSQYTETSQPFFSDQSRQKVIQLGIREEHVELPHIEKGSKVLDVGAGTGFLSRKMKDTFECDVFALEPSFERDSDYQSCVDRLGKEKVLRMTLQEALENFSQQFFQAFDVVTVFKYNVPGKFKEEFISALSQVVKPDGIVYITSVEPERFTFSREAGEFVYLTDTINSYFENSSFVTRDSFYGADQLMTVTGPKVALDETHEAKSGPK